jgi:two-component system, OmpR family, response regulator ResD
MKNDPQKRVLVVDDDATTREILSSVLERQSLVVDLAANGQEALDLLQENTYSVVLLDLLMPVLDGFTVINRISDGDKPLPVVLVVTGADRRALSQLDSQRIHGIVRKPFDPEELASLVVACAEIRSRLNLGTMAIVTMIAGSPFLAWLNRLT